MGSAGQITTFAGRDVAWFVDNTNALRSSVKGGSRTVELARAKEVIHLFSCRLQCRIWLECVPSAQTCAAEISRLGAQDHGQEGMASSELRVHLAL